MAIHDLPHEAAIALMREPKFSAAPLVWESRPNQANILMATFQPEDETGAIIPGLSIQLEVKKAIVVDRCGYEMGLLKLVGKARRRAYQLAVTPPDKRSHNDVLGPIYGPHEHLGDRVIPVTDPRIRCGELRAAFDRLCQQINLTYTGNGSMPL